MATKLYYKIGEACRVLDIQPYVLRYWETEFPGLSPTKSSSGQRVYEETDLAMIQRIKELLYDEGYTIAGAKKKLEGEEPPTQLKKAKARKAAPKPAAEAAPEAPETEGEAPESEVPDVPAPQAEAPEPPAEAEPEPERPTRPRRKARPKRVASAKADSARVAQLERAIRKALAEARDILARLDKSA